MQLSDGTPVTTLADDDLIVAVTVPGVAGGNAVITPGDLAADLAARTAFTSRYVAVPTAWVGVTFTGAWVDFGGGYQGCQYRKIGFDIVQMRGMAKTGTGAIFTLPAGFRPPARMRFVTTSNGLFGYGEISTGGVVTMTLGSSVYFDITCQFSVTA